MVNVVEMLIGVNFAPCDFCLSLSLVKPTPVRLHDFWKMLLVYYRFFSITEFLGVLAYGTVG